MAIKPTAAELGAAKAMESNPNFGKDCLEAIINETPQLRDALVAEGLVEEIKNG